MDKSPAAKVETQTGGLTVSDMRQGTSLEHNQNKKRRQQEPHRSRPSAAPMLGTLVLPPHLRQAHLARQTANVRCLRFLARAHFIAFPSVRALNRRAQPVVDLRAALNPVHMHAR